VSILLGKFGRVPSRIDQLAILPHLEGSRHQGADFCHGALLGADDRNPLPKAVTMIAICDLQDVGLRSLITTTGVPLSRLQRIRISTIPESLTPSATVVPSTITSLVPHRVESERPSAQRRPHVPGYATCAALRSAPARWWRESCGGGGELDLVRGGLGGVVRSPTS
jgi:hypothetical protein